MPMARCMMTIMTSIITIIMTMFTITTAMFIPMQTGQCMPMGMNTDITIGMTTGKNTRMAPLISRPDRPACTWKACRKRG